MLAIIPNKINDLWKTKSEILGTIWEAFFVSFVDNSVKNKRLILWLRTAQKPTLKKISPSGISLFPGCYPL